MKQARASGELSFCYDKVTSERAVGGFDIDMDISFSLLQQGLDLWGLLCLKADSDPQKI